MIRHQDTKPHLRFCSRLQIPRIFESTPEALVVDVLRLCEMRRLELRRLRFSTSHQQLVRAPSQLVIRPEVAFYRRFRLPPRGRCTRCRRWSFVSRSTAFAFPRDSAFRQAHGPRSLPPQKNGLAQIQVDRVVDGSSRANAGRTELLLVMLMMLSSRRRRGSCVGKFVLLLRLLLLLLLLLALLLLLLRLLLHDKRRC